MPHLQCLGLTFFNRLFYIKLSKFKIKLCAAKMHCTFMIMNRVKFGFIFYMLLQCFQSHAQTTYNSEQQVITGYTDVRQLERSIGYRWFKDGYFEYQPNLSAVGVLKDLPPDVQFLVFAGTWCDHSQQLLPRFYKTMDLAGISKNRIKLYFLDRDLRSPQGIENNYGVNKTPVFIIINKASEIGRITEHVSQSIEADLADLIPRKNE